MKTTLLTLGTFAVLTLCLACGETKDEPEPQAHVCKVKSTTIADLEPSGLGTNGWNAYDDDSAAAMLQGTTLDSGLVPVAGGPPQSTHAFYLKGSGYETWGANARLRGCWDASGYQGLRFWMKGVANDMWFWLSIKTTDLEDASNGGHCVEDCDNAYAPTHQPVLTPDWSQHTVAFSDLRLDNRLAGVTQYPFNAQVLSLFFIFRIDRQTPEAPEFEAWIDQVEFY